ncbi:MAG TPA: c-type cytochrome domain-containing protein [Puia sp.]|nr:c-type cytochrome domain-containing protein [Puia sp.]
MHLLTITEFLAHLHPALVHLPIGILLTALLLQLVARRERFAAFRSAIPVVLLAGVISAVLSCITGFLLFRNGDYDDTLVSAHMWLAIGLTFVAFALYARVAFRGAGFDRNSNLLGIGLFLLIMITGHLGGSLTHGEDYLTAGFRNTPPPPVFRPIPDVQRAVAYEDIVKPILASRCNNCHGANRQKGGLRLDNPESIARGGKDGGVLVAGKADSSELIKRILLPENEEHHMPPKDRPQLSSQELQLLTWWVDQGGDYRKLVKDLPQPEKIKPALLALQHGGGAGAGAPGERNIDAIKEVLPETAVKPADEKAIVALRDREVVVTPVAQNSNYLSVDVLGKPAKSLMPLLLPLKQQLIQLDLGSSDVGDSSMEVIKQCVALRVVNLRGTKITDKALSGLVTLPELRVLNLVGTNVTGPGLLAVQPSKHLHALYLYHTKVERKDWEKLTLLYKTTVLDSGGYALPALTTDTAIVRAPSKSSGK